jgi:arabinose-5-phosphate isomerase
VIKIVREVLEVEAEALLNAKITKEFKNAVETIYNLKGKLIVTGIGKSGLVGAKIASTLSSTGTSSFFLHPSEALHGDLGMIGKDDGVLAISYSGESEEVANILPHIKRFDVPLIAMTAKKDSTLAKYATSTIDISVNQEACPLGVAPTASTTLTMALGDALAIALMHKREFKREDFASFHPGGSLGKRLFVKVKDLMQSKNLPIISDKSPLKEAIVIMSEGRLGNAVIIDAQNRVVGVISDGDLRRYLQKGSVDLDILAIDIATKNPKFIDDENILAVDALKIIEDNKIQMLLVLDKSYKLKGLLHIHQLVEAGIG